MKNHGETMTSRYQQAQTLLQGVGTKNIIQNDTLFPHWIEGSDCFWYERAIKRGVEPLIKIGKEYRLVDAKVASNTTAFDHDELAVALAQASNQTVDKEDLPIKNVSINLSPLTVSFSAFDQHWLYTTDNKHCRAIETIITEINEPLSPDGSKIAFIRDKNLWLRNINSGEEWAITFDGEEDYSYGGGHNAWGYPIDAIGIAEQPALWSPDSTRLLVILRDKRQVPILPQLEFIPSDGGIRPSVNYTKVAYPGDEHVETFQLLAVDVAQSKTCKPDYPPLTVTFNTNTGVFFTRTAWWAKDGRHAYFIALTRGDRVMRLIEFDTDTGNTRVLFEETSETHINIYGGDQDCTTAHRILEDSNELLWWSELSGWGHLYLYDLSSGELIRQVTNGNWCVRDVLQVNEKQREILIQTSGRVSGRDPYYRDICRVHMDTGELTVLLSNDEDTTVHYPESLLVKFDKSANTPISGVSPSSDFIVVTRSRVDKASVSQLVNRSGELILELETADTTSLPKGWTWPEPVQVQAADGITPLYGVLYRPSNFCPDKSYPVINNVMAAPWLTTVPKGSFNCNRGYTSMLFFHGAALAELGFIVLQLDSRGTPLRGKAFQDESYGWVPDACNCDDHTHAIQQLAARYPSMDLSRVGSFSLAYSSGLINFLKCQDLYKVHVQGKIVDERFLGSTVSGDKWEGSDGPKCDKQNAEDMVENLRGKLLLMHSLQDPVAKNFSPAGTLRVIDALQQANKDFDMLIAPGSNASYERYATRRAFDYLVKNLLGEEPPKEFNFEVSLQP